MAGKMTPAGYGRTESAQLVGVSGFVRNTKHHHFPHSIAEVCEQTIEQSLQFWTDVRPNKTEALIAEQPLRELRPRLMIFSNKLVLAISP